MGAPMYIALSGKRGKGLYTIVDPDTFERFGHLTWYLSDTGYAVRRNSRSGTVRLHRLVANTPEGMVTDHKNHNRLDNRLSNLRVVSHKENMANYKGERGYTWDKSKSKWMVRYKGKFYGRYPTNEEAKRIYKLACSGVAYVKRQRRQNYYLPTGVFRNKSNRGYQAKVQINGKRVYLGTFSTIEEAQKAYLDRKRG